VREQVGRLAAEVIIARNRGDAVLSENAALTAIQEAPRTPESKSTGLLRAIAQPPKPTEKAVSKQQRANLARVVSDLSGILQKLGAGAGLHKKDGCYRLRSLPKGEIRPI
ncbi:hypothetical protein ACFL59_01730, partial [Planctomycetota bacterium]